MGISKSERNHIENEKIFRRANENIAAKLDKLDDMHVEDGNPHLVREEDITLQFKCECSDENCEQRIPIKLSVYQKIHENRNAFIIKPNHQIEEIENVIQKEDDYSVIEKDKSIPDIPEPDDTLRETKTDNS